MYSLLCSLLCLFDRFSESGESESELGSVEDDTRLLLQATVHISDGTLDTTVNTGGLVVCLGSCV